MTGGHSYSLTVRTEHDIPADVLIEHLAVAMNEFEFLGDYSITLDKQTHPEETMTRNHPFEGPEVFDDEPKPASGTLASGGYVAGTHGEGSFYIHPGDVIMNKEQAQALNMLAQMGAVDPYPNATEAAFQLRQARRDAQR